MIIKKTQTILFIVAYCITISRGQYGLENLDGKISKSARRQLRPLTDFSERFSGNLQPQLAPLQTLDQRIKEQVHQGLEPVRILESILKVKFGKEGTTIARYRPSNKEYVIRDSMLYKCGGTISSTDGSCSGTLQKFKYENSEDYCYALTKSLINNWYCISPSNSIITSFNKGKVICESEDGSPNLLITVDEYNKICDKETTSVNYKYFTNKNLEHLGNGLACSGSNPQVCTYFEKLPKTKVNSNGMIYSVSAGGTYGENLSLSFLIKMLLLYVIGKLYTAVAAR